MRVLVTGSSGFIGPHVVRALQARGDVVVGIDRRLPESMPPDVFVHGDLLDPGPLEQALGHGVDCIVHLAASRTDWGLSDFDYVRDNVHATKRLIEVGRLAGIRSWVVYSTVGVLGPSEVPLDDTAPLRPVGPYASSKAEAEEMFGELGVTDPDARITVIRPSAVFGPGNPPNTNMYRLIDAVHRRRFVMIGDGSTMKTLSYLPNLVDATMYLMDRMRTGVHTYIYVDAPTLSTSDLVTRVYRLLGRRPPRWHVPLGAVVRTAVVFDRAADLMKVDLPITSARIEKFCRSTDFDRRALDEVGFRPRYGNDAALQATVDWYLHDVVRATSGASGS